jgi:IclR family pca regulon transcriptional regulator
VRIANKRGEPVVKRQEEERNGDFIAGIEKGFAVIESFDRTHERQTIADVARMTGLQRATARRCLLTLCALGYAHCDGKFFSLTPRVLRLGYAYLSATPLPQILLKFLEELSGVTHESSSASTLDGTEILYIARTAQQRVMSIGLTVGSRLPAFCTSMGRVLLAALDPAQLDEVLARSDLRRLTQHTVTDRDRLKEIIGGVRHQGYALIDQELEIGLRSIAVPVFNQRRTVIAAINVGLHVGRMSVDEMREKLLPQLLKTQAELAKVLP